MKVLLRTADSKPLVKIAIDVVEGNLPVIIKVNDKYYIWHSYVDKLPNYREVTMVEYNGTIEQRD